MCVYVLGSCPLHFKHCMVVMYIENTILDIQYLYGLCDWCIVKGHLCPLAGGVCDFTF